MAAATRDYTAYNERRRAQNAERAARRRAYDTRILGLPERVWAQLRLEDRGYETPCLIWTGTTTSEGYGVIQIAGRQHRVHRLVHKAFNPDMPEQIGDKRAVPDHLCRITSCAHPDHTDPVTDGINVLRGESFAAVNAAKTHCDNNHEFTPENTHYNAKGHRACAQCGRDKQARQAAKRAAGRPPGPARAPKPKAAPKPRREPAPKPAPRELMPCGTLAARLRHIRKGEPIDDACRTAHAENMRKWRDAG